MKRESEVPSKLSAAEQSETDVQRDEEQSPRTRPQMNGTSSQWHCDMTTVVENFRPTQYELEFVARHYLDALLTYDIIWRYAGSPSLNRGVVQCLYERLHVIKDALGAESFKEATASIIEERKKMFAEADEEEERLDPCTKCGGKRSLPDEANGSALCAECARKEEGWT